MAKKSMILKQQKEPKFSSRRYNRCKAVRPSPRLPAGLRHLPYLLPGAGLQGPDPRCEESFLVILNTQTARSITSWKEPAVSAQPVPSGQK